MSARIPRERKAGHGDPKFCSCAACKALREGKGKLDALFIAAEAEAAEKRKANSGPFPGHKLRGTLEFKARGFCGFYNLAGEWVPTSTHHFAGRL